MDNAGSGPMQKSFAWGMGFAALAFLGLAGALDAPEPAMQDMNKNGQGAGSGPANKPAVAGSGIDILSAPLTDGMASEVHPILTTSIKTPSPADLLFQVTAECALWTDITTIGNDDSEAVATVKVWVTIDGETVPVASDEADDEDRGKVVFCNRAFQRTTSAFENENATIETFLRTRSANAFNWITFDVGSGTHDVVVYAQLESQVSGAGMAKAGIGKRTLFIEPLMMANGSSV